MCFSDASFAIAAVHDLPPMPVVQCMLLHMQCFFGYTLTQRVMLSVLC